MNYKEQLAFRQELYDFLPNWLSDSRIKPGIFDSRLTDMRLHFLDWISALDPTLGTAAAQYVSDRLFTREFKRQFPHYRSKWKNRRGQVAGTNYTVIPKAEAPTREFKTCPTCGHVGVIAVPAPSLDDLKKAMEALKDTRPEKSA